METGIPYIDPLVRDLSWAISSPALLQRSDPGVYWPDRGWFLETHEQYGEILARLEQNPDSLHKLVNNRNDLRLGSYFETLWRFWLGNNGRYRLLFANLPLRSRERTIGEFDFLLADRETGKTLHWEVAVKFYLGTADTSQPGNWWGPARRDRLDIKTRRLLDHQAGLSRHPQARQLLSELGIQVDETWLILKGRLFYPALADAEPPQGTDAEHLRGFWIDQNSLFSLKQGLWLPLERRQWLAPLTRVDPATCRDNKTLLAQWQDRPLEYPLCVALIEDGMETERGFIVPDNWSNAVRQSL